MLINVGYVYNILFHNIRLMVPVFHCSYFYIPDDWSRELKILGLGVLVKFAVAVSFTIIQVTSGEILPKIGIFSCITIAHIFLLSASFIGYLVSCKIH